VLAHPMSTGNPEAVVPRLMETGLGGIEVDYGEYTAQVREQLRQMADRWGLIPTGGSDFHGAGFKPGRELGGPEVDVECVEQLRAASRAGRANAEPSLSRIREN
nr:PHP domain-containing protein [Chloroflexota bacterium]